MPDALPAAEEAVNAPPPPKRAIQQDRLLGLFGGNDSFDATLTPEARTRVQSRLRTSINPGLDRQRLANVAFLADRYQRPSQEIAARLDYYRNDYARQMFSSETMDDVAFYTNAGRLLQEEADERVMQNDMVARFYDAAAAGKALGSTWNTELAAFTTGEGGVEIPKGWKNAHRDVYNAWASESWTRVQAHMTRLQPAIDALKETFKTSRAGVADISEAMGALDTRTDAVDALLALPKEERGLAISLAARGAVAEVPQTERGAVTSTIQAFGEGAGALVEDALTSLYSIIDVTIGHTPEEAARQGRFQVERTLNRVIAGEIDPVKGDSLVGEYALKFTRSAPMMLAALTPAGLAADFLALKQQNREALEAQGVPSADAEGVAAVQAIPQTVAFFVTSKMAFLGKTPFAATGNFANRLGGTLATEVLGQFIINEAAQITTPTIQQLASVFDDAVPGVKLGDVVRQQVDAAPDTIALSIIGGLIGTGVAMFKSRAVGESFLKDERVMDELGFKPAAKEAVKAADVYEDAVTAWREGWAGRDITSRPTQGRSMASEAVAMPGDPVITREGDGSYTVTPQDGSAPVKAATPEGAVRAARDAAEGAQQREATKPPQAAPERDGSMVPPKVTQLAKDEIAALRGLFNMDELPPPDRERFEQVLNQAKGKDLAKTADEIAADVRANPRVLSAQDHAAMVLRSAELQNQYEQLAARVGDAYAAGDKESAAALRNAADGVLAQLDNLTEASDLAGTQIGRALSIRRMRINRDTYTLARLRQRARTAKQAELSPEQQGQLTKLAEQIATQEKRIKALQADLLASELNAARANAETFVQEGRSRRREATGIKARERRVELKRELAKLGYRMNDITGVVGLSYDAAAIIAKIADTYIEEGVASLDVLVGRLKQDIPDLTESDIFNAVGRQIQKNAKKIEGEAKRRVRELRNQAALWAKIYQLVQGKKTEGKGPANTSQQAMELRVLLRQLRQQANRTTFDDATLQRINEKISEVQKQLEGGFRAIPDTPEAKPKNESIEEARKQLRELEGIMRTEDAIADLTEQLRTGHFKVSAPEQRIVTNARLENALIRRKELQREVNQAIENLRPRTVFERAVDVALLPRVLMATADMSATLRQGLLLSASRPGVALKAFGQSLRAMFDQHTADAIELAITSSPAHLERQRAKLFLSSLDVHPNAREESFLSTPAEKIPVLGTIIRASNRSMVTTLNLLRVAAFDGFVKAHPETTAKQRQAYAAYVNAASGRGNVKWSPSTLKTFNALFFAPRYAVSRFQALYSPFKNIRDKTVRNAIARDFVALGGTGMTVLGLAAWAGADVTLDPTESDFGKIVIDDTRVDIWGGLQQPMRLILSVPLATANATGLEELEKEIDPIDAALQFMQYKFSPAVSVPRALLTGENVIGQEQEPDETLLRAIVPLLLQETADVYAVTESPGATAAALAAQFVGLGVQQHDN